MREKIVSWKTSLPLPFFLPSRTWHKTHRKDAHRPVNQVLIDIHAMLREADLLVKKKANATNAQDQSVSRSLPPPNPKTDHKGLRDEFAGLLGLAFSHLRIWPAGVVQRVEQVDFVFATER